MLWLKQGDKMKFQFPHMNKHYKILFIILLLIFIVVCASFKVLMVGYENQAATLNESSDNIRKNHISTTVLYANEVASKQADDVAERLSIKIKDAYPDLSVLENELKTGNLENTKIMHILYDEINHVDLFNINNSDNRLFIFLEDGYIVDNQIRMYGKAYHTFGEDKQLDAKNAFDTFVMGADYNDNHIFYSKAGINNPSGTKVIMTVNQEEFFNRILDDLNSLDTYEVYAVAYITPDGDIFGHTDVSPDLKRNNTHKIIVVQSFNVNDVLLAKSDTNYKEAIKYNETLQNELREHVLLHSFFFILFFILFMLSTLISFFIFINDKKCSNCEGMMKENDDKWSTIKHRSLKTDQEKSTDNSKS